MPVLLKEDWSYPLPSMVRVRQTFARPRLEDIERAVRFELGRNDVSCKIVPGSKVAVAVGSRGIKNLFTIVKTTVTVLSELGAKPFIVSAMGSHGGGNPEGQREVLYGYGITEKAIGVPVITDIDVTKLGTTSGGEPVYFDSSALAADLIVPINRVKLHTDFVGPLQSGLCKMLVIGLGNHIGCSAIHEVPPERFAAAIESAASVILASAPVGFGLAIVENAYDETALIEAVPAEHFITREKELVKSARDNMPTIGVNDIDVLIMEEMGKNISGAGYDPNIVGRSSVLTKYVLHVPKIQKMVLLNLTDVSHGNGIGIGMFDVITNRVYEKLDLEATYANAVACKCIDDVKIPLVAQSAEEAVRIAVKCCRGADMSALKIVQIKNTLELEEILVSPAMLPQVKANGRLQVLD